MKKDPPEPQGQYTYADAMNQWAAGQDSYFRRVKAGMFHPGAASSGLGRLMGYIWRFILLALIGAFIYWTMLKKHLKSETFADEMAAATAAKIGADEVSFNPFRWKGQLALTPVLSAKGSSDSFFREMSGTSLQFRSTLSDLFQSNWKIRKITIGSLDVTLRSGGMGAVPEMPSTDSEADTPMVIPSEFETPETDLNLDSPMDLESAPAARPDDTIDFSLDSLDLKSGGLGIQPNFSDLEFEEIAINNLTLNWGLTDITRGALENTTASIVEEGDGWNIEATGGTFSQNWLPPLNLVTPLTIKTSPGLVTIEPVELQLGSGSGILEGSVTTGDAPEVNMTLAIQNAPLSTISGNGTAIDSRIELITSGTVVFTGSTNTSEGIHSKIDLDILSGTLRNIPVLEALALPTTHGAFRRLSIESGKLTAESSREGLEVKSLRLISGEVTIEAIFDLKENYYDGVLHVTIPSSMLKSSPATAALATIDSTEGTAQFKFPLEGELEALTKSSADEITAEYQKDSRFR
ncbi:hypothetical protein OAF27_01255 [Verrucomicrobiales bacterium]|nr:hypothetical protein [Verrucomicrobiales bacterium]